MKQIIEIQTSDIIPDQKSVLLGQGIISENQVDDIILEVFDKSMELFSDLAHPKSMLSTIDINKFADIYEGEGNNEIPNPVENIYPKADIMALFAVTVGDEISAKIQELFAQNDFAEGCMLDSIASSAADRCADIVENEFCQFCDVNSASSSKKVMRYSPGYCGWHISAQKKMFAYLDPDKIGISLRDSFLMDPLKSISGVLICGPKQIHYFENDFPCCEKCETQTCQDRIGSLNL